jgi:putative transposase
MHGFWGILIEEDTRCEVDGRRRCSRFPTTNERTHIFLAMTRSRSLPAVLTLLAKFVLTCEREPSNSVVAAGLAGPHTIGKWRDRFNADRIESLYDDMRSGRPRAV